MEVRVLREESTKLMKVEGNAILLHVDGEVIGCTTEATLSINNDSSLPIEDAESWDLIFEGMRKASEPELRLRPNIFPRKVKKRLKAFFHCRTNFFHYKGITLRG